MGSLSKETVGDGDKDALRRRVMNILGPCSLLMACEGAMLIKARSRLIQDLSSGSTTKTAQVLSAIMGAGALLEFFATPLLCRLSDVYGRRLLLLSSVYTIAISRLAVVIKSRTRSVLGLDRMITMVMATSFFATIRAIQADLCENGVDLALSSCEIARWAGVGLFVGPYVEAVFTRMGGGDHSFAFLGASALSFSTALLLATQLKETLGDRDNAKLDIKSCLPFTSVREMSKTDSLRLLLTVCFLQMLADPRNLFEVTQSFLREHLGWSQIKSNNYMAATGATLVLSTFFTQKSITSLGLDGHTALSNVSQFVGKPKHLGLNCPTDSTV